MTLSLKKKKKERKENKKREKDCRCGSSGQALAKHT
jgi:hypothetical protein